MGNICIPFASGDGCSEDLLGMLIVGVILTAGTLINYYRMARNEKKVLVLPRIQILIIRLAGIVPMFSIIALFAYIFPPSIFVLEAFEALVEGYCIYCFFKAMMLFIASEDLVINYIRSYQAERIDAANVLCFCFHFYIKDIQTSNPKLYLSIIRNMLFQFFAFRPIIVLLAGIFHYITDATINPGTVICVIIYIISLIAAMMCLLRFYHIVSKHITPMNAVVKILFVKAIILVIIIQNLIVNQKFAAGYV